MADRFKKFSNHALRARFRADSSELQRNSLSVIRVGLCRIHLVAIAHIRPPAGLRMSRWAGGYLTYYSNATAHYFSYVGAMAFSNFVKAPAEPGAIMDQLAKADENDILIAISFSYYSSEVVRATEIARAKRTKVIAITDSYRSPLAIDAAHVIEFPLEGPQYMPSLSAAFMTVELILAALASHAPDASQNIADFEEQILNYGGYVA